MTEEKYRVDTRADVFFGIRDNMFFSLWRYTVSRAQAVENNYPWGYGLIS